MLRASLLVALGFFAWSVGAAAQAQSPAPSASCAVPNADAKTLYAPPPVMPDLAAAQHITGEVMVRITLDERSKIVSTQVVSSPSALLNNAAVKAAEESTFATRIRNCVPVADSYYFIVDFSDPHSPLGIAPAAMTNYFSGAWRCTTPNGLSFVRIFGLTSGARSLIESSTMQVVAPGPFFLTEEIYDQHGTTLGVLQRAPVIMSGTSPGWEGNRLIFRPSTDPGAPPTKRTLTYERLDDDHFARSAATVGGDGTFAEQGTERCARLLATP